MLPTPPILIQPLYTHFSFLAFLFSLFTLHSSTFLHSQSFRLYSHRPVFRISFPSFFSQVFQFPALPTFSLLFSSPSFWLKFSVVFQSILSFFLHYPTFRFFSHLDHFRLSFLYFSLLFSQLSALSTFTLFFKPLSVSFTFSFFFVSIAFLQFSPFHFFSHLRLLRLSFPSFFTNFFLVSCTLHLFASLLICLFST